MLPIDLIQKLPPVGVVDHPWADSSRSPYYVTRWPTATDEDDINGYFDAVDAWLTQVTSPWVTVMDFSKLDSRQSTVARRKVFADRARQSRILAEQHCVGLAAIAPSTLVAGIVNSLMWVVHSPLPARMFTDEATAEVWLVGKLRDAAKSATVRPPSF